MKKLIASGAAILALGLSVSVLAQPTSIESRIEGKTHIEKARIKSDAIVDSSPKGLFTDARYGIRIDIQNVEKIEGGVQVFARAFAGSQGATLTRVRDKKDGDGKVMLDKEGKPVQEEYQIVIPAGQQIGFGLDGTVDIERFRIFNPPVLVPDPKGKILRRSILDGDVFDHRLREDPQEAIRQTVALAVSQVGKTGTSIDAGKVGNTTSVFYPSMDGQMIKENSNSWATTRGASDAEAVNDSATVMRVGVHSSGDWVDGSAGIVGLIKTVILWDTAALPDTDTVSTGVIAVWPTVVNDDEADAQSYVAVVASTPASDSGLVVGDFDQVGTSKLSADIDLTGLGTGAYTSATLTSLTGINATGISKYGIQEGHSIENSAPSIAGAVSRLTISTVDAVGSTQDPTLTITHVAAAVAPVNNSRAVTIE